MPSAALLCKGCGNMKKGSKKETPKIYKGPDYKADECGIEYVVPGSPEYYSVQDLAAEAKRILEEYGFKLSDLFGTQYGKTDREMMTYVQKYGKENLYRYFGTGKSSITMPNDALADMVVYMKKLGMRLESPSDKAAFSLRVDELGARIEKYCLENGLFREKMTEYLKKQKHETLLRFLKSIYVLQLSEEAWCYWLCYTTLNSEKQREAKSVLSGCIGLLPNYKTLFSLYFFNRDDIAFQHLVLTAEEKCGADKKKLTDALVEIALAHFQRFSDKIALAWRVWDVMNFDISLSATDWSILLTYEHLCDKREISRVGEYVLSAMGNGKNLQKGCTIELARHFARRFREQKEDREESELEQFLSFDGADDW